MMVQRDWHAIPMLFRLSWILLHPIRSIRRQNGNTNWDTSGFVFNTNTGHRWTPSSPAPDRHQTRSKSPRPVYCLAVYARRNGCSEPPIETNSWNSVLRTSCRPIWKSLRWKEPVLKPVSRKKCSRDGTLTRSGDCLLLVSSANNDINLQH